MRQADGGDRLGAQVQENTGKHRHGEQGEQNPQPESAARAERIRWFHVKL